MVRSDNRWMSRIAAVFGHPIQRLPRVLPIDLSVGALATDPTSQHTVDIFKARASG